MLWLQLKKHKSNKEPFILFTLRQLQENVVYKYISISVASILMMLTIMLIADGSTRIISNGNELTKESSVYDFTIVGEEQTVHFRLRPQDLGLWDKNMNFRVELGSFKVMLGASSTDIRLHGQFEITP